MAISISIPINLVIFLGIVYFSLTKQRKNKYKLAQYSARLILFIGGQKVTSTKEEKADNNSNAYYLGNFIGIESLPALIFAIDEPTCLILRWFNFFIPIFGWAFFLLDFIPFSRKFSRFQNQIKKRILDDDYSVVNFPGGFHFLKRDDKSKVFKSVTLNPFNRDIKIIPFAITEHSLKQSVWYRSEIKIKFFSEIQFNSEKSKKEQIQNIESTIRMYLDTQSI
ncbi:1-acyl-sn-glycerol-3-phosphate acyltransferase [Leptospira meyeri]|uniref:1-acyl-sn-glycerol-3-phosphate acyltransferase n=1 Tax=Leptospira meyeri TaxID=29508 RepID=A0A4R8MQK7_LEPME|nr:1-acyl-sn-glycerol-3-phosphate acyltransferase [Leptospira meyeri]